LAAWSVSRDQRNAHRKEYSKLNIKLDETKLESKVVKAISEFVLSVNKPVLGVMKRIHVY
jgi:hypothetical protein